MKHILIGTAGHVDHGKTALIRALTGIETDRLKEEKKRGITIDLGFANIKLPSGITAGIVDVPGHEKFIKNMLAGAGGIDLVLLVIAADDGVMPQTREHLGILELLNAKNGIVVVTKSDLVDEEWLSLVTEDIKVFLLDSFLKDAPIVNVSSISGTGIDDLKNLIDVKIAETKSKDIKISFRIPVDRVFSSDGFGTVITGTLIEGKMEKGDLVEIYPLKISSKIRNLQVHGEYIDTAFAGQRVAVNLSGISREDISRGDVIAPPESMRQTQMIDVKVTLLKDSPREIKSGTKLHFYYGTANVLCKIILIGMEKLKPGASSYAQLRFTEKIAVKRGDSFVLRFYSPIETIGGGLVLSEMPKKYRQNKMTELIKSLESLEQGGIAGSIRQAVFSAQIANLSDIKKHLAIDDNVWTTELDTLVKNSEIILITNNVAMEENYFEKLGDKINLVLQKYHDENPLQPGIKKEELRSQVLQNQKPAMFDKILLLYKDLLKVNDGRVLLSSFKITYTKEQKQIRDNVLLCLIKSGFTPPPLVELLNPYQKNSKKLAAAVVDAMLTEGVIIQTEPGMVFATKTVTNAKELFSSLAAKNVEGVTLAEFRDATNASRKFSLSLLDYFDRILFTKKVGDSRLLI